VYSLLCRLSVADGLIYVMQDPVLTRYLRTCCRRLHQQQAALVDGFSLRTCLDIEIQPASGVMSLDVPGRGRAIATVAPIARYSPASRVWRWSWSPYEPFPLQGHGAIALQSLADKTGLALFAAEQSELSLTQALLVLAVACSQLKAGGYYRWLDGETFVFLAVKHMAFATAQLEYSRDGDRLGLSSVHQQLDNRRLAMEPQTQVSQLVRPSPSLLGKPSSVPAWPAQRNLEGLFAHLLCQPQSLDFEDKAIGLRQARLRG